MAHSKLLDESLFQEPLPHDNLLLTPRAIHLVIELAHLVGGNRAGESLQGLSQRRNPLQDISAGHEHSFVRWKVAAIVFELNKVKGRDPSVRGIPRNHIDLARG